MEIFVIKKTIIMLALGERYVPKDAMHPYTQMVKAIVVVLAKASGFRLESLSHPEAEVG